MSELADQLDLVLFATFTPDVLQPHAAPSLVGRLGARFTWASTVIDWEGAG